MHSLRFINRLTGHVPVNMLSGVVGTAFSTAISISAAFDAGNIKVVSTSATAAVLEIKPDPLTELEQKAARRADTYVPEPPYCTCGLRVPASCVLYVPAQGSLHPGPHCSTPGVPQAYPRRTVGAAGTPAVVLLPCDGLGAGHGAVRDRECRRGLVPPGVGGHAGLRLDRP